MTNLRLFISYHICHIDIESILPSFLVQSHVMFKFDGGHSYDCLNAQPFAKGTFVQGNVVQYNGQQKYFVCKLIYL